MTNSNIPAPDKIKEFYKKKESNEWIEKNFKEWKTKKLNYKEMDVLKEYWNKNKNWQEKITAYLEETQGELIEEKHPKYEQYRLKYDNLEKLNSYIQIMDRAFKKSHFPETVFAFRRDNESQIFRNINTLRKANGKIDRQQLEIITKHFQEHDWENVNYIHCSLTKEKTMSEEQFPILFRYKLSQEIHCGALLKSHPHFDLTIGRNHNFIFKNSYIISGPSVQTVVMVFDVEKLKNK